MLYLRAQEAVRAVLRTQRSYDKPEYRVLKEFWDFRFLLEHQPIPHPSHRFWANVATMYATGMWLIVWDVEAVYLSDCCLLPMFSALTL